MGVDDLAFTEELDFGKVLKNPILDIAARFWEDDRYDSFKTCYLCARDLKEAETLLIHVTCCDPQSRSIASNGLQTVASEKTVA